MPNSPLEPELAGVERMRVGAVVASCEATGRLAVEIEPSRACGSCRGSCFFWSAAARRIVPLACLRLEELRPGERVEVSLPTSALLRSALWIHGLPWLGLLAGAMLGQAAMHSDVGCLMGALGGVLGAYWLMARGRERLERSVEASLQVHRT